MRRLILLAVLFAGLMAAHEAYQPYSKSRESRLVEVTRILTSPNVGEGVEAPAPQAPQEVAAAEPAPMVAAPVPDRVIATDLTAPPPPPAKSAGRAVTPPAAPVLPAQPAPWQTAVFETAAPAAPGTRLTSAKPGDIHARVSLVRSIQAELKRVRCYHGDVDGSWGSRSKEAMRVFVARANASLPTEEPDYFLLTLLQNHQGTGCSAECPRGQSLSAAGQCVPNAILARDADGAGRSVEKPRIDVAATERVRETAEPGAPQRAKVRPPLPGRMAVGAPMPAVVAPEDRAAATASSERSALAALGEDELLTGEPAPEERPADEYGDEDAHDSAREKRARGQRATAGPGSWKARAVRANPARQRASKPDRQRTGKRARSSYRSVQNLFTHPLGRM